MFNFFKKKERAEFVSPCDGYLKNLSEVKNFSVSFELLENATSIELIQVKQGDHDITEHFTLEKDGSKFILNFDEEMTQKILSSSEVFLKVTIKETISLEVPSFV